MTMTRGMTLVLAGLLGCGGSTVSRDDDTPPRDATTPSGECAEIDVSSIEDGLGAAHPCRSWLEAVRGRVGAFSLIGSFTVMSRRTTSKLAVVVSAAHTQGNEFDSVGTTVAASLVVPATTGVLKLKVPPADGALGLPDLSPLYTMFHDAIPAAENNAGLTAIRPRHDFFVGVVDGQRIQYEDGPFPEPADRMGGEVPLYDPTGATTSDARFAAAAAGEQAILVGYPKVGPESGAFSVGRILSDGEATAALAALAAAGDEEGSLAYDPEVEFLVDAVALPGMSGGGVFDRDGRFLGAMVRASSGAHVPTIVRVVRMTFIEGRMAALVAAYPQPEEVATYVDEAILGR